jgi:hypothetical protein
LLNQSWSICPRVGCPLISTGTASYKNREKISLKTNNMLGVTPCDYHMQNSWLIPDNYEIYKLIFKTYYYRK